jgi:Tol biopolymer transport system component
MNMHRPAAVSAVLLTALLALGACDSSEAPLAPDMEAPSLATAKGLPSNGPIYFSTSIGFFNSELFSMNPDGTGLRRLTYDAASDQMPDVSRDGRKVTFVSKRSGSWEIYSMNADGGNVHRLTTFKAGDQSVPRWPRWSPDGRRIAYERLLPGETHDRVFVMGASGSSSTALTDGTEYARQPAWSPDGTRIAYTMTTNGAYQIFVAHTDGSGATPITDCGLGDSCDSPVWSPDGTLIVFRGFPTLQSVSPQGVPGFTYPEDGVSPAFSPDGTKLAYTNAASQTLHVLDLKGKEISEVLDVSWSLSGISWSR